MGKGALPDPSSTPFLPSFLLACIARESEEDVSAKTSLVPPEPAGLFHMVDELGDTALNYIQGSSCRGAVVNESD